MRRREVVQDAAAADRTAIALLTAAAADRDECAQLAAETALAPVDTRVLVAFCLVEVCWAYAPATATSAHPVHAPVLAALRRGNMSEVRRLLVSAMTGRQPPSYAALLVQLAYLTVDLVEDLPGRLPRLGLSSAAHGLNRPSPPTA